MGDALFKIEVYIPESHVEQVKLALFAAGSGRVGDYDACAWQTLGQGQYRPLEGSQPFIGTQEKIETVTEYKVELVCAEQFLQAAIEAMKASHPYEEVAYCVTRMESIA